MKILNVCASLNKARLKTALFLTLFLWLGVVSSHAADTKFYRFTNNTGQTASDLHVTFTGTGGSLTTVVLVNPPGCPPPVIPSNGTVTNTSILDWQVACVAPGASVTVKVTTNAGPIAFNSGFWTGPEQQDYPGIGALDPERDVEQLKAEDVQSNGSDMMFWILISLIVLLLLLAYYLWRKLNDNNLIGDNEDPIDEKLSPLDEAIIELESKRDLIKRLKRGRPADEKANLDAAIAKLNEAIEGLKKMKGGGQDPDLENKIQKAINDAADKVDAANTGRQNLPLKRLADCLRDIARNLF